MNSKELDRFFIGKMRFCLESRTRHDNYQVVLQDLKVIPLPVLLTVSRGTGELTRRNLKGLAANLGISLQALDEARHCRIGRMCILLCLAGRLIDVAIARVINTANKSDCELAVRMCESSDYILDSISSSVDAGFQWNVKEIDELNRVLIRSATGIVAFERLDATLAPFETVQTAFKRLDNMVRKYEQR